MEEQLIGFETAKLAKDKGYINKSYKCYCQYHVDYNYDDDPTHSESYKKDEIRIYDFFQINTGVDYSNEYFTMYEAPTQSLLQKWLREKHSILIFPYINFQEKDYFYCSIFPRIEDRFSTENFLTYEEALESGLQEALKLIK